MVALSTPSMWRTPALLLLMTVLPTVALLVYLTGAELSVRLVPRHLASTVSFSLHEVLNGPLVSNLIRETYEQDAMAKFIRRGDVVLNIGGNVGTSCIVAEILARGQGDSADEQVHTFCVEPDRSLREVMKDNFQETGTSRIEILHSVIADADHCPEGVPILGAGQERHGDRSGAPPERLPRVLQYASRSFAVEVCHTFKHVANLTATGRLPSVIFGDCEGCLPSIWDQFKEDFASPEVRLVIYERDGFESAYREMEEGLTKVGFRAMQVGWVCVWQKGPLILHLQLWVPFFLVVMPWLLTLLLDGGFQAILGDMSAIPLWRVSVVVVVTLLCESFGLAGVDGWALVDGLPYPEYWLRSSWGRGGIRSVWQVAYLFAGVCWPVVAFLAQVYCRQPPRSVVAGLCWSVFASSVALGYFWAELRGVMGQGSEPQKSIWEASLVSVITISLAAAVVLKQSVLLGSQKRSNDWQP